MVPTIYYVSLKESALDNSEEFFFGLMNLFGNMRDWGITKNPKTLKCSQEIFDFWENLNTRDRSRLELAYRSKFSISPNKALKILNPCAKLGKLEIGVSL